MPSHLEENSTRSVHDNLSALRKGSLLLAREELRDPNFIATTVLICMYERTNTIGLVCNRPSHMPLSEIFSLDDMYKDEKRKIYIGGPVQQETLQVLQITGDPVKNSYTIAEGIYLGGEWGSLEEILAADQEKTRLFLGYSGWSPGQLENEIRLGAWDVYNVDLHRIFTGSEEPLLRGIREIRSYLKSLT